MCIYQQRSKSFQTAWIHHIFFMCPSPNEHVPGSDHLTTHRLTAELPQQTLDYNRTCRPQLSTTRQRHWGPILEFARDSFLSTFPRLSNEMPPTAFSKSHRRLTASHRSRFVERKVRVVFTVRHLNLVYEIAEIKLL